MNQYLTQATEWIHSHGAQYFIDGQFVRCASLAAKDVYNPADGTVLGRMAWGEATDAMAAMDAAARAFPTWRLTLAKERHRYLLGWAEKIRAQETMLAHLLTLEQGKILSDALAEIRYAVAYIEWFAEEAKRIYGHTIPSAFSDQDITVTKEPVGVIAAITPWNFPAAMVTRKLAAAFAAGCTAVLKPSEETPFTALFLAAMAKEAGLPAGVMNVVTGDPVAIGQALTQDARIRKLSFTGSTAVGKMLMAASAPTLKRLSLELGGNAPFIIEDDADVVSALQGLLSCKFRNAGQTCICANRVLVHRKLYESVITQLEKAVSGMNVGKGWEEGVHIGPLINEKAISKIERLIAEAISQGARLVCGGKKREGSGWFFEPTILAGVTASMAIAREEIFGPVLALQVFDSTEEAIELANGTEYGLAAYVYTASALTQRSYRDQLEFGMVAINNVSLSNEMAPFGGVKYSGFGREGSFMGIEEYLQVKYMSTM